MGLGEGPLQGCGLLVQLFLQPGDLCGEREDEVVVLLGGRGLRPGGAGPAAELLYAVAQDGMVVEEGVRDAGLALDGLEGDRVASLDQGADCGLGIAGLGLGLAAGGGGEGGDALVAVDGYGMLLRWCVRSKVTGVGPVGFPAPWQARPSAA